MFTSIVLINTERDAVRQVAEDLAAIDGFSEVYSVTGRFDLIAIVRTRDTDEIATLITEKMQAVKGIVSTETMLAFRAYSRHDLESMFSLGMD